MMKLVLILFTLSIVATEVQSSENLSLKPSGSYEIKTMLKNFGGLSAVHLTNFGNDLLVLTDKGIYFKTKVQREINSQITNVSIIDSGPILDSSGNPLSGRDTDSESIAYVEGKGFFISFESNNRIMLHKSLNSPGQFLPKHDDFKKLDFNKGFESIAVNSSGELFAIPEKPPSGKKSFPIYKFFQRGWRIVGSFEPMNDFLVSDAIFGPNDELLILERAYDWRLGFKTQIRVLETLESNVKNQYILLELDSGKHNYEGISIWKNEFGSHFVTLISDNNFLPFITSDIKEFELILKTE